MKIGYRQVGGPLSVVKFFAQIWHPKSTPYYFSLPTILSVTHILLLLLSDTLFPYWTRMSRALLKISAYVAQKVNQVLNHKHSTRRLHRVHRNWQLMRVLRVSGCWEPRMLLTSYDTCVVFYTLLHVPPILPKTPSKWDKPTWFSRATSRATGDLAHWEVETSSPPMWIYGDFSKSLAISLSTSWCKTPPCNGSSKFTLIWDHPESYRSASYKHVCVGNVWIDVKLLSLVICRGRQGRCRAVANEAPCSWL